MDAISQTLLEYVLPDGRIPFRRWMESLPDREIRARIRVRINRVRLGNFGDAKSVGDGVSELRIPYGPGYRVYFGRHGGEMVILLCGGDKSTQQEDIRKAKEFWADYRRRVA